MSTLIYRYWGKARAETASASNHHLLPYHSLDVAAVGHVFLQRHTALRRLLATRLSLPEDTLIAWHTFFLALHDIGKFSKRFQGLIQHWPNAERYTLRHDSLGWLLWRQDLVTYLARTKLLGLDLESWDQDDWFQDGLDYWARAVTGHHGQPPEEQQPSELQNQFSPDDCIAAREFVTACAHLLLTAPLPALLSPGTFTRALRPLSWWLAGIAILCDWIGSNSNLFPYHTAPLPLTAYWKTACEQAQQALDQTGVLPLPAAHHAPKALFPHLDPPTPLQQLTATLPLDQGLFILEDVTGAGKTEAALLLAQRLVAQGAATGVYIALPTLATSNAMFERLAHAQVPQKFFTAKPSFLWVHNASHMQQEVPTMVLEAPSEADYTQGEFSAANQRGTWLYDNRKKALLADFSVGTVDQALLAVLYSRYQALRLLGLANKILIVDEVHACDAYMQRLLEILLKFHASIGGSAILLSATLPLATRRSLATAWATGSGCSEAPPLPQSQDYPLLTYTAATCLEIPLKTRPSVARTIQVTLLHQTEHVHALLLQAIAQGRCACWIRNTVAEVLDAFETMHQAGIPAATLTLFHARFTLGDRLDLEKRILTHFGKESHADTRRGSIVIATQVLEHSLDLDFDIMISDLAPIDLLIQRAGRLCRHTRDAKGDPARTEQREQPCLFILSPKPLDAPPQNWFNAFSPGAAAVYPHHGQLWLTARLLQETGAMVMPAQARMLIESVYSEQAQARIPETLHAVSTAQEGKRRAEAGNAAHYACKLHQGYTLPGYRLWEDAQVFTRLGEPTVTVRLARWENDVLQPWHRAARFDWELSQVTVRESRFKEAILPQDKALAQAIITCCKAMPDQGRWSKLLVLRPQPDGTWAGAGSDKHGKKVMMYYDATLGLRFS